MPGDQRPPGSLRLGDKWLQFVGEGSANTIWALNFVNSSGGDADTQRLRKACDGYLLRIQKYQTDLDGSDSAFTARDHLDYLQHEIRPLFGKDPSSSLIVKTALVDLPQSIIDEANAVLDELDERRRVYDAAKEKEKGSAPKDSIISNNNNHLPHSHLPLRSRKFVSSRVGPAGTHMLSEDFRARRPSERFAEIKPKWLAQSPTAPPAASTCRNCAVAAKRYSEAPEGQKPKKSDPAKYGCPLHLVNSSSSPQGQDGKGRGSDGRRGEDQDWKRHAERIFRGDDDPRHSHFLFASIRAHGLLPHLRALQAKLAHRDTFLTATPRAPDVDLLTAMTLRDCSLFFRYEVLEGGGDGGKGKGKLKLKMLDFKLADLDKKTPQKIPSWQDTERGLIDGGWYEGKKGHEMPNCYLKQQKGKEGKQAASTDVGLLKNEKLLGAVYEE